MIKNTVKILKTFLYYHVEGRNNLGQQYLVDVIPFLVFVLYLLNTDQHAKEFHFLRESGDTLPQIFPHTCIII